MGTNLSTKKEKLGEKEAPDQVPGSEGCLMKDSAMARCSSLAADSGLRRPMDGFHPADRWLSDLSMCD